MSDKNCILANDCEYMIQLCISKITYHHQAFMEVLQISNLWEKFVFAVSFNIEEHILSMSTVIKFVPIETYYEKIQNSMCMVLNTDTDDF